MISKITIKHKVLMECFLLVISKMLKEISCELLADITPTYIVFYKI